MRARHLGLALAACTALALAAAPATAQKSKDTLRYVTTEAVKMLDPYFFTHFEASPLYETIYEPLVQYDARNHKIVPYLAKSWSNPEPGVYDFDLREDIVFSNGDKFEADDVVYFLNWTVDPKVRIHNKPRYRWAKSAEKLGPHKVRIRVNTATPKDLLEVAGYTWEQNSKIHSKLADKGDYGRNPIGTGPYRIAEFEPNKAIVAVPNERFTPSPYRIKARVKRIEAVFIPDQGAQIAEIVTGGVDIMRDPSPDHMKELAKHPELEITAVDADNMIYMQYDGINRSGNKALSDVRVRKALTMAIDRDELIKHLAAGGSAAKRLDSMCFTSMQACDMPPVPPHKYDPAQAKKLLAEAGYAKGLEVELICRNPSKDAAVGIAGYWNAVGVKATVQLLQITTLDKYRAEGKLQAYIGERPLSTPDASHPMQIFFFDKRRDYWNDETIRTWATEGLKMYDPAARSKHYKQIFDRINTEAYMLPIHTLPSVYIHRKEVKIYPNPLTDSNTNIGDFGWK